MLIADVTVAETVAATLASRNQARGTVAICRLRRPHASHVPASRAGECEQNRTSSSAACPPLSSAGNGRHHPRTTGKTEKEAGTFVEKCQPPFRKGPRFGLQTEPAWRSDQEKGGWHFRGKVPASSENGRSRKELTIQGIKGSPVGVFLNWGVLNRRHGVSPTAELFCTSRGRIRVGRRGVE